MLYIIIICVNTYLPFLTKACGMPCRACLPQQLPAAPVSFKVFGQLLPIYKSCRVTAAVEAAHCMLMHCMQPTTSEPLVMVVSANKLLVRHAMTVTVSPRVLPDCDTIDGQV